ncbi:transposase, partial [Actinomadura welshii]
MRTHVRHFAQIMMNRGGRQLEAWMASVLVDDLPELHSLVTGLRRDPDAVTAGLTMPYSSGSVEGHVNPRQTIKRQMFGRAGFDRLRKTHPADRLIPRSGNVCQNRDSRVVDS